MRRYIYKNYDEPSEKKCRQNVLQIIAAVTVAILILVVAVFGIIRFIVPAIRYSNAAQAMQKGDYLAAARMFLDLGEWSDSAAKADECYAAYGIERLSDEDLNAALSYYNLLSSPDTPFAEEMRRSFYDYANLKAQEGDTDTALFLFSKILSGHFDSDMRRSEIYLALGDALLSQGNYLDAYEQLKLVDNTLLPSVNGSLTACRQSYYDALVMEFQERNAVESPFYEKTYIPEGFFNEMLDGFLESENYRIYSKLVDSSWEGSEYQENVALIYQLGDFLNTQQTGFVMRRLYCRRYSNEAGSYFEIKEDGTADSNLPRYFLSGYYGLYSKVEDNIYYIGSDEVRWTKQFSFTLADNDETLWVYCHSTGYQYMLTLEK